MSGRQYFYKMNGCPAENSNSPECICWHDDGTGPMLSWPTSYGPTDWRDKPIAPTQGADGESLRPVATLGLAIAKDQARMLEQWAEESRVSDPQQWNDMLMIARNLVELATRDAARGAAAPTAPNTGSVAAFDLIDVTPGAKEDIAYACRPNFYNGPGLTHDRLTEIRAYIEKRIPESRDEVPFTINSETLLELIDNILHYDDRAFLATRDATPIDAYMEASQDIQGGEYARPVASDAHSFALMCDALPVDFNWGDALTPDVFRHIESVLSTRDAAPK